jgi:uncharacterized protein
VRFIARSIEPVLLAAAGAFPSVVVTGPRRSGKTTLLCHLFPRAQYVLLEDLDVQARARSDPRGLLDELRCPVLFDEIQNVPELFDYVRTRVDLHPRRMGQWLFTGSQEAPLMRGVTESMTGRAAVLQLLPLSLAETPRISLQMGGFPEVLARPKTRELWFASYLQTYLERDLRAVLNVRDLSTFRRFLALAASRHGQVLNRTDLAAPMGISVPTVNQWLNVLELTGQVVLVPPYFENFGKRLTKSPKLYFVDSGLICHLLGIRTQSELERSPFLGAIFEGFIASEILKSQVNAGARKELYYFRDQQGLEVDFLVPVPGEELWMIECKATKTVHPAMANPLVSLGRAVRRTNTRSMVVHRASPAAAAMRALVPGVEALPVEAFVERLAAARKPRRRPSR